MTIFSRIALSSLDDDHTRGSEVRDRWFPPQYQATVTPDALPPAHAECRERLSGPHRPFVLPVAKRSQH
jgi:hypothetical protein